MWQLFCMFSVTLYYKPYWSVVCSDHQVKYMYEEMMRLGLKEINNIGKLTDMIIGRHGSILRSLGFYETLVFSTLRPWPFVISKKGTLCSLWNISATFESQQIHTKWGKVYKNAEIILRGCGFLRIVIYYLVEHMKSWHEKRANWLSFLNP